MQPPVLFILIFLFPVVTLLSWNIFFGESVAIQPYRYNPFVRSPFFLSIVLAILGLFVVLVRFTSSDVRGDPFSFTFYFSIGEFLLLTGHGYLASTGLNFRDEVFERANLAASWACGGAFLGMMISFAGANIGEGPGWWSVLYPATLAITAQFFCWMILTGFTPLIESISIERDTAAGLRAFGFWIGSGLILAQAVAGDWSSFGGTTNDFMGSGWPVLVLLPWCIVIEHLCGPGRIFSKSPLMFRGTAPALLSIAAGFACVKFLG